MQPDLSHIRVLDPAVMDKLHATFGPDCDDVIASVVSLFVDGATTQLQKLQDAAALGDVKMLEQLAHQLRGSALQLGAERMVHLASVLEELARQGATDRAASLVESLIDAFQHTQIALRQLGIGGA